MPKQILILTQPRDLHSYAVAKALIKKGHAPLLWHTSDFPDLAVETVSFDKGKSAIRVDGPELVIDHQDFDTVWNRRPNYSIPEEKLHPSDIEFAELGCRLFRKSLFDILAPEAFWVNPHESMRRLTKLLQHKTAVEVGFTTPDTVFTNDPETIRDFLSRHNGKVVFKPISTLPWKSTETSYMTFTSSLTPDKLVDDDLLRATPGIYQEEIDKEYELRVTVMGRQTFSAKILSQQTRRGTLDWRKAYDELTMEKHELPREIEQQCFELLRHLGFVFGCFDLIVRKDGSFVFLEVNQMGQFLFLERYTGLPLLDAFTDFLIEGSVDFEWCENQGGLRYLDLEKEARAMAESLAKRHRPLKPQVWEE